MPEGDASFGEIKHERVGQASPRRVGRERFVAASCFPEREQLGPAAATKPARHLGRDVWGRRLQTVGTAELGPRPRIVSDARPAVFSLPSARELPLRDVRDLALAVVEGAVAAESLAKELRKTPDRSKHFQDIAERLRSVVGRPSIRTALADDATGNVALARPSGPTSASGPASTVAPLPIVPPAVPPPKPTAASGEHVISEVGSGSLARIEGLIHELRSARALEPIEARLARIEQSLEKIDKQQRRDDGERYVIRSPEEALAFAARMIERLRREPKISVRLDPGER